ncbi:hypothetical protein JCGZ_00668 [Jatropha curcas]|uniref:F-box associated domain-containing protein n=2 Tax=Jatropha curcas TaxID=180498 RepID=A0A067KRR9_JATCU|nr:hypothetical protein JCGZ_00668 [Jatropha curcas]
MLFDMKDELFREMMLPERVSDACPLFTSIKPFLESSIAIIYKDLGSQSHFHIWVMKEYGVTETWMKLATVKGSCRQKLTVLGFRNYRELFIGTANQIASYELESQREIDKIIPTSNPWKARMFADSIYNYVESLALLDKENDTVVAARMIRY